MALPIRITLCIATTVWFGGILVMRWLAPILKPDEMRPYFDFSNIVVIIAATAIAYEQLRLLVKQQADEHRRQSQNKALSYSLTRNPRVLKALQILDKHFRKPVEQNYVVQLEELLDDNGRFISDDTINNLQIVLAHWESLALTIGAQSTDEDMAFEMGAQMLIDYVNRYSSYITKCKEVKPRVYQHLLALKHKWEDRIQREEVTDAPRRYLP